MSRFDPGVKGPVMCEKCGQFKFKVLFSHRLQLHVCFDCYMTK